MARVNVNNYSLGMAQLTFYEDTSTLTDGSEQVAWTVGNVVNASIAPEVTYLDHYYVTNGSRKKDRSLITNRALAINFTFDEITAGSMKEWLLASAQGTITDTAYEIYPMAKGEIKGCAVLTFASEFGRNYAWAIPCASMKPDGTWDYNAEDWMNAKGILECLVDATTTETETYKPFGTITFSEAEVATGAENLLGV